MKKVFLPDKYPQLITMFVIVVLILFGSGTPRAHAADTYSWEFDPVANHPHLLKDNQFTGGFTYNYKIDLPPGRANLTPDLNLVYDSGNLSNDSNLAYGWSFSIPSIVRLNKHGSDELYNYTDFNSSFSGELEKESSTTYKARVETGPYYTYTFENNYWTVYDQNGTRYLFGENAQARQDNTSSSTQVYRWMLEEVRDTNDNYIRYTYFKNNGQIYPGTIIYTGHGSTDGIFKVSFASTTNPLLLATMYDKGFALNTSYRINSIKVYENDEWVRKYDLSYQSGDKTQRSLLSSVQETGRDPTTDTTSSKPATEFTYKKGHIGWQQTTGSAWNMPTNFYKVVTHDPSLVRIRDVNGDSYPDVIEYSENEGGCGGDQRTVYINNANGTWTTYNCSSYWTPPHYLEVDDHTYPDSGVRIADYNGDQLNDFAWSYASTVGSGVDSSSVRLNSGHSTSTWGSATSSVPVATVYGSGVNADNGTQIVDVNGDGLADIVRGWNGQKQTYINNGYGWDKASSSVWEIPRGIIVETPSGNEVASFAQWMDINGDGLTDYIFRHENASEGQIIGVNTGNDWNVNPATYFAQVPVATEGYYNEYLGRSDQGVRSWDANGDGVPDLVRSVGDATTSVYSNVYLGTLGSGLAGPFSSSANESVPIGFALNDDTSEHPGIADINADGVADLLFAEVSNHGNFNTLTFLSTGEPFTDMLTNVTTSEGASTTVTYKMSSQYFDDNGNLLNPHLPILVPTVEKTVTDDGLGNIYTDTYTYAGGHYYYNGPFDRGFAGFATTTKTDNNGNVTKTYYHQGNSSLSSIGEYNDDIAKRGQPYRIEQYDDNGNLYKKTINKWDRYDRGDNASFVKLDDTVESTYNGNTSHKDKAESYEYNDSTGYMTQKTEWGTASGSDDGTFSDTGSDELVTTYTYATSTGTSSPTFYLLSGETTVDHNSDKVREKKTYYDGLSFGSVDEGNPTKVESWVSGNNYVDIQKSYNSYGLVTQVTDPRDNTTTYSYDSYDLYPATTTNPLSQVTTYQYDYPTGEVLQTTDPNGMVFQTELDPLGRISARKQPDISSPSTLVTKTAYTYTDDVVPRRVQKTNYLSDASTTDTYTYFDGLDRKIEERTSSENSGTYTTKDYQYDENGLVTSESLPYFSTGTAFTGTSSPPTSNLNIGHKYDALNRLATTTNAVGTTTYTYNDWTTTKTDALDNQKDLTYDAYGNLTGVDEHNGTSTYSTAYEYDGNNNLTKITDALDNIRNFTYDGLGRRLTAQDLHAGSDGSFGTWSFAYDDSGNLASTSDPKGQVVDYTYDDANRVLTENYTGQAGTEVEYGYDSCTNGIARLCSSTTTGAVTYISYNPLGQTATETKTANGTDYTTSFSYDRQGDKTLTVYPDGSEVKYTYNNGGSIESIAERETGGSFSDVISNFDYAPNGLAKVIVHSNGVTTTKTFDADALYRLSHIVSTSSPVSGGGGGGGMAMFEMAPGLLSDGNYLVSLVLTSATSTEASGTANQQASSTNVTDQATSTSSQTSDTSEETTTLSTAATTSTPTSTSTDATTGSATSTQDTQSSSASTTVISATTTTSITETSQTSTSTDQDTHTDQTSSSTSTSSDALAESTTTQDFGFKNSTTTDTVDEMSTTTSTSTDVMVPFIELPIDHIAEQESIVNASTSLLLGNKNAYQRATIKAEAISKLPPIQPFEDAEHGLRIDIVSLSEIPEGVQVFVKAWRKGSQLGFGPDGTVEIERIRIINPPILIYKNGARTEDLEAALKSSLAHTVSIIGKPGENIVKGRVGHTTTTVYPDADPESTSVDGNVRRTINNQSWSQIRTGAGTQAYPSNSTAQIASLACGNSSGFAEQNRADVLFDTSAITDEDTVYSATISLYGFSKVNDIGNNIELAISTSAPASNTNLSSTDYSYTLFGETSLSSTTIPYSSWSLSGYNDYDLNDIGLGLIDKAGITKLGLRSTLDLTNTTPVRTGCNGTQKQDSLNAYMADNTGTANDPVLVVETTPLGSNTGNIQDLAYTYDAVGNVTQLVNSSDSDTLATTQYNYDDLNRLLSASTTVASSTPFNRTYTYDAIGNIASKSDQGSYAYDGDTGTNYANPHAATAIGSSTLTYDENGNLTSDGTNTYTWDYRNRLTTSNDGTATTTYTYDGNDDRISKTTGSDTTVYPSMYYSVSGATSTKYIYAGNELTAYIEGNGTATSTYHVLTDHLGGTNVVTDENGNVTQSKDYYPFGAGRVATGTADLAKGYIGQYHDPESDLSYLNARYYNTNSGQFLSEDPVNTSLGDQSALQQLNIDQNTLLADPQRLNTYSYSQNNPVTRSDPSGLCGIVCLVAYGLFMPNVAYAPAPGEEGNTSPVETVVNASAFVPIGGSVRSVTGIAEKLAEEDIGKYSVYLGKDAADVTKYVGITKRDPIQRFGEHLTAKGTGRELLDYGTEISQLSKYQARQIEQGVINTLGLQKNGGQLLNKINSITPSRQIESLQSIRNSLQKIVSSLKKLQK